MPEAARGTGATPAAGALLDDAERAFQEGDWRRSRALAARALAELGAGPEDEPRRQAAREILDRFRADPQLVLLYLAALLSFVAVCVAWLRR